MHASKDSSDRPEPTEGAPLEGLARTPLEAATLGALLGTFVGDALGQPYEGTLGSTIPARPEIEGVGTYTDDTEMTIALTQALVDRGELDPSHAASVLLEHCDPGRGYGPGALEVLKLWSQGVGVDEAAACLFAGEGSFGNGAAMRVAPIAILHHRDDRARRREAERSARLTHTHPLGVEGAALQADAIAAAARAEDVVASLGGRAMSPEFGEAFERMPELLERNATPREVGQSLGCSVAAYRSVPTAIFAAAANPTFEAAVGFAVRCGGDTDTIGAMAGAIAGARDGLGAIPERWLAALENGRRGRDHLAGLAARLAELAA